MNDMSSVRPRGEIQSVVIRFESEDDKEDEEQTVLIL